MEDFIEQSARSDGGADLGERLHLARLPRDFGVQSRRLNRPTDLPSDGGHQCDLVRAMAMRLLVLEVNDSNDIVLHDEGNGQKCLVPILRQVVEHLKPGIVARIAGDCNCPALLCDPTRDAFAQPQPDPTDEFRMGVQGGFQHQLVFMRIQQVDKAGISLRHLHGDVHNVTEDAVQIQIAADRFGDLMKDLRFTRFFPQQSAKRRVGRLFGSLHGRDTRPSRSARGDAVLRAIRMSGSLTGCTTTLPIAVGNTK